MNEVIFSLDEGCFFSPISAYKRNELEECFDPEMIVRNHSFHATREKEGTEYLEMKKR